MTSGEMIIKLQEEVKGLASYLTAPTDYNNAIDDALRETEWSFPVTVSFKTYWLKERSKRHLYNYLRSESAAKFKAKKFNLNERFDHYHELIKQMDADFQNAIDERPDMFRDANPYELFGTKVDAGFQYDYMGKDTTYSSYNDVVFDPNDVS